MPEEEYIKPKRIAGITKEDLIRKGIAQRMYAVLMTEKDHQGNFNNFPFEDCDFWVEQITDKDTIAEHGEGNAVHVIVEHPDYVLKKRFISAFIATRRWGFGRADMPLLDEEQFQLLGL